MNKKPILQPVKSAFFTLTAIIGFTLNGYSQIQIGQDIDGDAFGDETGHAVSMPDANTIAVGSFVGAAGNNSSGYVRVYSLKNNTWVQKGLDIIGEDFDDDSGYSVSIPDANTVAIGAISNDGNGSDAGHVRVYTWDSGAWIQKGLDIDGEMAGDAFGWSVSMPDANIVAIGSKYNDGNGKDSGHVRVYTWDGNAWTQKGLDIDGEAANRHSGHSVSMPDANTVAIGAYLNAGNGAGHVRVFSWDGNAWAQKGSDINGKTNGEYSGWSVSMPDTYTVAIGANRSDVNGSNAGLARVYNWDGSSWTQKGLDIYGEATGDWSGYSVSMPDANTVGIGAMGNAAKGPQTGHVRVYMWNGFGWTQKGLDIDGESEGDRSGWSVSMGDAHTVTIGAPKSNHGNVQSAGHARVYKLRGVQGLVYNDVDLNCILDDFGNVPGIRGIVQPGEIVVETTPNGVWNIDSLPNGNYTITYDTTGLWKAPCTNVTSFTVINPDDLSQAPSLGMTNINPCSEPNVSIHMPIMRRGFSQQKMYVQACNAVTATGALKNAFINITLDDLLKVDSATQSYSTLSENKFRFNIGTLEPGECVNFELSTTVSTSAFHFQTLCMEALLFPMEPCLLDTITHPAPSDYTSCDLPWDESSLNIDVECVNDSLVFTITNTSDPGIGDMDCFSPVRLYIDGQYIWLDSVQLKGGESFIYSFAGDGRTWRMEVDQHPLHPRPFYPSATIELCGDSTNWTPGLVDQLPHDDDVSVKDIFCGLVIASYDPNDKTGSPLGVGPNHHISPNTKLDYVIRFQNTGNDTAFTVVIRDTLDLDLDIFSVTAGVSSHDYQFRMHGPRVLEWTFYNILLPDSTTNESNSHGFVTFTVHQIKDLLDGTEINNSVGIYFDFNEPVITNTTSHIVDRQLKWASWTEKKVISGETCNKYEYNGFTYTQSGSYYQIKEGMPSDTLITLNLIINKVSDLTTAVDGKSITANNSMATYQWLDCDQNYAVIPGETDQSFTAPADGNYAVQLVENNCVDTSACVAITTVGILENSFIDKFTIYPNPTAGQLFIHFDIVQEDLEVSLYTLDGKLLENSTNKNASHFSYEIKAPAGIYLLKISNNKHEATMRVVKN